MKRENYEKLLKLEVITYGRPHGARSNQLYTCGPPFIDLKYSSCDLPCLPVVGLSSSKKGDIHHWIEEKRD